MNVLHLERLPSTGRTWRLVRLSFMFSLNSNTLDHSATAPPTCQTLKDSEPFFNIKKEMVESTLELNYQKEAKRRMSLLYRVKTKKGLVCFLTIIASNKLLSSAFSNWTGDLIQPFRKTLFDQL